jgi:hypothetical protein
MRSVLALLLSVLYVCGQNLSNVPSRESQGAIKDPADVRLGMAQEHVTGALQSCCHGREENPKADIWGARDHRGEIWTIYFDKSVVVEISHARRVDRSLLASELLQLVTNDLVQHCPEGSPPLPGKRGPGLVEAYVSQYGSPESEATNPGDVNWRASMRFSCGTHSITIGQLDAGRADITFMDAVPNPFAPNGVSVQTNR